MGISGKPHRVRVVRTNGAMESGAKLCKLGGAQRRVALSQNAARQPNYYEQGSIGKVKRSPPNVMDVVNMTLEILKGFTKTGAAAQSVQH